MLKKVYSIMNNSAQAKLLIVWIPNVDEEKGKVRIN